MNPQVTLRIEIGESTTDDGLTLSGVIEENTEVVDRRDFVEDDVVDYVEAEYGVTID